MTKCDACGSRAAHHRGPQLGTERLPVLLPQQDRHAPPPPSAGRQLARPKHQRRPRAGLERGSTEDELLEELEGAAAVASKRAATAAATTARLAEEPRGDAATEPPEGTVPRDVREPERVAGIVPPNRRGVGGWGWGWCPLWGRLPLRCGVGGAAEVRIKRPVRAGRQPARRISPRPRDCVGVATQRRESRREGKGACSPSTLGRYRPRPRLSFATSGERSPPAL